MIHAIGHLMNLCVWSSNEMCKAEPNGSPPIMTLHMNTFSRNRKWECQPRCNIFHHLAFDLHTLHTFSALGDSQDNDVIT